MNRTRTGYGIYLGVGAAVLAIGVISNSGYAQSAAQTQRVDFNWDVRPILSDNCFRCHGPDSKSRQAGLRLDDKASAYAQAIVPSKPQDSELIRRITSKDPGYRMPPPSAGGKTLSEAEISTLTNWVTQGAEYKQHWSFTAPVKPTPPATASPGRAVNDIDRFVLARLQEAGLGANQEADKETLINRVSLTLTGLPPTLEDVDAFVRDRNPNAYEKLVDRLLASPAYGEHMSTLWLDAARFSESDGFLDDHHDRLLWPWRDWVISAFNRNLPFDQFTTWQVAGDLLPNHTKEQLLATAFLRVGKRTTENGAIHEEYRVESALDKTETIGKAYLGLTVGCARCHDHKYDPIRQRDYYSLSGFFNSTDEPGYYAPGHSGIQGGPTLPWTDAATDAKIAAAEAEIKRRESAYATAADTARRAASSRIAAALVQPQRMIEAALAAAADAHYSFDNIVKFDAALLPPPRERAKPPEELVSLKRNNVQALLTPVNQLAPPAGAPAVAPPPANVSSAPRGGLLPNDMKPELSVLLPDEVKVNNYAVVESALLKPGPRGNALYFNDINRGFLGRDTGRYERTSPFSLDLWMMAPKEYPEDATVINHLDDENSGAAGYTLDLQGNRLRFRLQHSWPNNMVSILARDKVPLNQWIHVSVTYDGSSRAAGVVLYVDGKPAPVEVERDHLTRTILPMSYAQILEQHAGVMFGKRFRKSAIVGGAVDELRYYHRALTPLEVSYLHAGTAAFTASPLRDQMIDLAVATDPAVMAATAALASAREAHNKIVSLVPQILVMGETPKPRTTYRLNRGVYSEKAEEVPVQGLELIFPYANSLPNNRIGLAQWLLDERNPLTTRVFVNRIWQMHFGRGIVDTPQDFGMQGSKPTNPQLLDWLAVRFRESGWDVKALHKLIVLSASFRQSSDISAQALAKDPENRLISRGVRQRMPAEMVRDKVLAISGLLAAKVGGPSVHPYQPQGIWESIGSFYPYPRPNEVPAEEHHRRTLYTFVKRNAPHPEMAVFDMVDRNSSAVNRNLSNSPLQALALLNDVQFVEAYRVLAAKVMKATSMPDEQMRLIYRLTARKNPTDGQFGVMWSVYQRAMEEYRVGPTNAEKLAAVGVTPLEPGTDTIRLAALANVAAVVMNTPDAYSIR